MFALNLRLIASVVVFLVAVVGGFVLLSWLASPPAETAKWERNYIPNVPVVTQDGKTLRFYDDLIKGKIVAINFVYTTCLDICPLASARLAQVQERFADRLGKDMHFITVSIDPETDTPAMLKAQAQALHAGPGWYFLTGKPEDIAQIRYKFGERSRTITEHKNEVMLGNDATGEWARDSVFGDIERFVLSLREMDPAYRGQSHAIDTGKTDIMSVKAGDRTGEALFLKACSACHSLGQGDRVGPDLAGITTRRDRGWLERFISNPERMRTQGDPIALELAAARPGIRMPNLGISPPDAADLIKFLEGVPAPAPGPDEKPLESLFKLTTQHGRRLQADDVKGRPVGVVFGFTRCPDVCPTTLLDWSNHLASLGPDGDRIKLLFVSVDSERDTPETMKAFMGSFDPRITALTGSAADIGAAAKAFDAFYEKIDNGTDFAFDHTIKTFLIDRDGRRAGAIDLNTQSIDRRQLLAKLLAR